MPGTVAEAESDVNAESILGTVFSTCETRWAEGSEPRSLATPSRLLLPFTAITPLVTY